MKKSVIICLLMVSFCLVFAIECTAVPIIVDANEVWNTIIYPGESILCIAHYIPEIASIAESLVFEKAPEPTGDYSWGDWSNWSTAISGDQKMVYLYGPIKQAIITEFIFKYKLFFQWDSLDPDLDPEDPVYVDTAIFNIPIIGSSSFDEFFWKGEPGNEDSWDYEEDPRGGPYPNPVPEPLTIYLLGAGAVFLRRRFYKL